MEIHKPKAVHGWRELINEIGVIIIGVLIALSAEQAVEWVHWQNEVGDAREALAVELGHDVGAAEFRFKDSACIARRIAELSDWSGRLRGGRATPLAGAIGSPGTYGMRTSSWEIVKTNQIASHIPLGARLDYGRLYDLLENFDAIQREDGDVWAGMQGFNAVRSLNESDLIRLDDLRDRAARAELRLKANMDLLRPIARKLGIATETLPDLLNGTARICHPILVGKVNSAG